MHLLRSPLPWLILLLASPEAFAHSTEGFAGGFMSGLMHPVLGPDHVIAMVAVGLWGAFLGRPAIWLLPIVFPMVMAVGGAMGVIGIPIPFVEVGIAVSAIVLGLMVAYCDNDGSELRENFIGSEIVLSGPKDRGYIDAGLFGSLTLDE